MNPSPGGSWPADASEALADRFDKILLRCRHIEQIGSAERARAFLGQQILLPDNLDAMRQVAALSGAEIVELAPDVVLLQASGGDCQANLEITLAVEHVSGMGSPLDPAIDNRRLEFRLQQTSGLSEIGRGVATMATRNSLHYWPSREGVGRELYVVSYSSDDVRPKGVPGRGLKKVAVEGVGAELSLRTLWHSHCDGPVGDVEIDFDGDNVGDIVCFSGIAGDSDGWLPLVVVSGATGKPLGKLEGEEFVITQTSEGVRIRSMEIDVRANEPTATVSRVIAVRDQAIAVEHSERATVDRTFREPFQPLLAPGSEAEAVRAMGGRERLLDHFVALKYPSATSEYFAYRGIRPLRQIGGELSSDRSKWPEGTRVLLDYTPPRATAEPQAPQP